MLQLQLGRADQFVHASQCAAHMYNLEHKALLERQRSLSPAFPCSWSRSKRRADLSTSGAENRAALSLCLSRGPARQGRRGACISRPHAHATRRRMAQSAREGCSFCRPAQFPSRSLSSIGAAAHCTSACRPVRGTQSCVRHRRQVRWPRRGQFAGVTPRESADERRRTCTCATISTSRRTAADQMGAESWRNEWGLYVCTVYFGIRWFGQVSSKVGTGPCAPTTERRTKVRASAS